MNERRIGIIDIGSNSIRLVIFEWLNHGAYRVIDESKQTKRLSQHIGDDGMIGNNEIDSVAETLIHFKRLCQVNRTETIHAVATAAFRNAANGSEAVKQLEQKAGLAIHILSGEEEARLGFLAIINTINVSDGYIIDIGGGSTEITLFEDRAIVRSISFPFGAVNTAKAFSGSGASSEEQRNGISKMVRDALRQHPWIAKKPGLPLIGLGGTMRTISKIDQRRIKYSLPLTHNYEFAEETVNTLCDMLQGMSGEERKHVDGLSKDRADIFLPGLIILQSVFQTCQASHYITSGVGLRDGLMFSTLYPDSPKTENVLEHNIRNLLYLHPSVPIQHVEQVDRIASKLFDDLGRVHGFADRFKDLLHAAALLYRIGTSINYYDYHKHTYYLIAHSRIGGLTHREILMVALIASYKNKKRTRMLILQHRDILTNTDFESVVLLGSLLILAKTLDRSETQPVSSIKASKQKERLNLFIRSKHSMFIEQRELEEIAADFKKEWGTVPFLIDDSSSSC